MSTTQQLQTASSTAASASTAAAGSSTTMATSTRAASSSGSGSGSGAAASSTFSSPPAETVALTTTFTPPASCTQNQLTLLSSPGYNIWLNEPSPVPGSLFTGCYPSQFISGYTSLLNRTSSIAPVFSPLVCPQAWQTVNRYSSSYIACCPSGYALHPPTTTVDTNRPAYGGTCYSAVSSGSTYTVTAYDASTVTATQPWPASNSLDQFYAHVIEGFAMEQEVLSASSASASTTASASSDNDSLSGGAIAGIVIGILAFLALVLGLFFFLFRRRQRQHRAAIAAAAANNRTSSPSHEVDGTNYLHETAGDHEFRKELPATPTTPSQAVHKMESPGAVHELDARERVAELDGSGGAREQEEDEKGVVR